MGIAERKLRQKENVRAAILSAACSMAQEEGWQSLSIRKIAEAIEYSVPVIYEHFENKEAILLEISKEGFRELEKKLEQARKRSTDPEEQLKALADAYWNFAFRNPEFYQLMYGLGIPCCGAGKMKTEFTAFSDLMIGAIKAIIKKKKSNPEDACFKYQALWSVLHGLISIVMMRKSDIADGMNKKMMDDVVNAFIKNL
ncbi:TetR/AcrR family transcriptional regulator [Compostibacter hankyongensis]|uniref:TetR/AcrR family transcriptional regulator n=1 Tax=Compostibacter hankyongensis TaxID=1007089 RepID=A0ABP8FIK1_9BACT